jgi:hypothetical protein
MPCVVRLPVWLTLGLATVLLIWGALRIRMGLKKHVPEPAEGGRVMGGGFSRMQPRTHLVMGVVYILFSIALVATTFGWNPLGNSFGPGTEKPAKDKAPTKSGIPVDQLPSPKKS